MSSVDGLRKLPVSAKRALYFGLQRVMGARVAPAWRELLEWSRLPPGELQARQDAKLGGLLEHALRNTEHYRALGISPRANETPRQLLARFPVLTRGQVREHFDRLIEDALRSDIVRGRESTGYGWTRVSTGGTTGVPTTVVHDAATRDSGRATRLFSQMLCGFPLGTPYFRLWGAVEDIERIRLPLHKRVLSAILGETCFNAFRTTDQDLRHYLQVMGKHPEIRHMMAYVDVADHLAQFIEASKLTAPRLDSVMACAGTVTKDARERIERVFRARLYNKYGSRECADIACECEQQRGLHIYSPHVFVEILDDDGRPRAPGDAGRVIVTLLTSRGFPMIRYDIGDLAALCTTEPCGCGISFPRLQSPEGRTDESLTAADGHRVSPMVIRHFIGVHHNRQLLREWQVEQIDRTRYVFRYVAAGEAALDDNLEAITTTFRRIFGDRVDVQMVAVPVIPPTRTGKQRWIINSWRP